MYAATDGKYTVTVTADTNIVVGATAPADPEPSDPEPSAPGGDEKDQGCGGAMPGGVPFIVLGALARGVERRVQPAVRKGLQPAFEAEVVAPGLQPRAAPPGV